MDENKMSLSNETDRNGSNGNLMSSYFGDIYVILPSSWESQPDCLHGRNVTQTGSKILLNKVKKYHPDFILGSTHPIFRSEPWSNQFGGCTVQGHGVVVPYTFLTDLDGGYSGISTDPMERLEKYAKAGS